MQKRSASTHDKALAVLALILSLIVFIFLVFYYPGYVPQGGGPKSLGSQKEPSQASVQEQVRLDYLYADWCSYCALTRPALISVAMKFGPAVSLNEYNEALRSSNPDVAALYADYKKRGLFVLFPTIVAHGPKGESALAGLQNEENILRWLCAQYNQKPSACKEAK
jgi:thiol-disulfide isomerase/thioredoxin